MKKFRYAVLGAGRQGEAIIYDLAVFGDAEGIILIDQNMSSLVSANKKIRPLLNKGSEIALRFKRFAFPKDQAVILELFKDEALDVCVSGLPYYYNRELAKIALEAKVNFCDLGGNTDITFQELSLHKEALKAGVSIIPDCGLMPGAGNILAAHAISQFDECEEIKIYVGGLPQWDKLPLGYKLTFSAEGLINEYSGNANILKDGEIIQVPTLTQREFLEDSVGGGLPYEAFITSGGTSTAPWSFRGKVKNYVEKTIRHKGHLEQIMLLKRLGLFETTPVAVDGKPVIPQEFLKVILEKELGAECKLDSKDMVIFILIARGKINGEHRVFKIFWEERENENFTAMQKTTGYSAAIVAIMQAQGKVPKGALPPEIAVSPQIFLKELKRRGFDLNIRIPHLYQNA